ncbi:MAG: iron-binding protein [Clostridiales bacterium GWB2_37_7]|nr:MAG: iron-binding protein [Clostridiales bacterium GWB2_37_7]
MINTKKKAKIKILKDGAYVVSGNVPLYEKNIFPKGEGYEFKDGRELPQSKEYSLCRCGKSKNAPFCDDAHEKIGFDGTETASKDMFEDRAEILKGPGLDLMDDHRCALARFCHRKDGSAWGLTRNSDNPKYREEAIIAASECPAGRLVALDKSGKAIEPEYEPSIFILQDVEKEVSGGIFVRGNVPIESSDGELYEVRNRVVLCRCGESKNKPFCDATHLPIKFFDK